ncbi:hypothetical protein GT50_06995 [Geobacillus stearothermophilus 10]|nr:hypothetical protein GT50_06995 [Geobacillus stearothermophilus 10]
MDNQQPCSEKQLSKPFPQKIINIGNKLYINNYTDLDMKGDFFTIIDKNDLSESFFAIENPAYFDYNKRFDEFIVSNPRNGTLRLVKNGKVIKKMKVGDNCSIVKAVEK